MIDFENAVDRRTVLSAMGQGVLLATTGIPMNAPAEKGQRTPAAPPKPIEFTPIQAATEQKEAPVPTPYPPSARVGFAIVGLGRLSINQILPGFAQTERCRVTALVSGDRGKALEVARQHGVPEHSVYDYENFDRIRDNPDVEVVYIVLPNAMHEEYTVRAAKAGKHVLCEKPMATSVAACERMIAACKEADRKLMIAYRIQYERLNALAYKYAREKKFGQLRLYEAVNAQNQANVPQWRHDRKLAGGGSLPDIGLYCLNTARYLCGEEPVEVLGSIYSPPNDPRFREVEERCLWQMRFPSGLHAQCASEYSGHRSRRYRVHADDGWFGLDSAFDYSGLRMECAHAEGDVEHRENPQRPEKQQFALELDHMAWCVMENRRPYTPGEEGLQDQRIMEAIYRSAREGKPITLPATPGLDAYRGDRPPEKR